MITWFVSSINFDLHCVLIRSLSIIIITIIVIRFSRWYMKLSFNELSGFISCSDASNRIDSNLNSRRSNVIKVSWKSTIINNEFIQFRSFILSRPSRRKLKQSGILKERVFGCDLGEHLLNSGRDSKQHSSRFSPPYILLFFSFSSSIW